MNLPYFLSILLVISVHLIIQFILKYLGHAAAPRVSLMTPLVFVLGRTNRSLLFPDSDA